MNFIKIVHKDHKGLVVSITEQLGQNNINIDKIDASSFDGFARIHLYTSETDKALSILNESGFRAVPGESLLVKIADRPGELARISRLLYDKDIDIRSITMIESSGLENVVAIVTDDDKLAGSLLNEILLR